MKTRKEIANEIFKKILNGAEEIFINKEGVTIARYYDASINDNQGTLKYFYVPIVGYPFKLESEGFRRIMTSNDTGKYQTRLLDEDRNTVEEIQSIIKRVDEVIEKINIDDSKTNKYMEDKLI